MDETTITASVQQITSEGAILEINGQTVRWPAQALPAGTEPGQTLTLQALTEGQLNARREEQARAILSEILGGEA